MSIKWRTRTLDVHRLLGVDLGSIDRITPPPETSLPSNAMISKIYIDGLYAAIS